MIFILSSILVIAIFAIAATIVMWRKNSSVTRELYETVLEKERLAQKVEAANLRAADAEHRISELKNEYAESDNRFNALSAKTLSEQHTALQRMSEQQLRQMLDPLRHDIETFRKRVDECYNAEARERFALKESIGALLGQSADIGREARELSKALRGNSKIQGDWGEMILEQLLENSGLAKGREYDVQVTRNDDGTVIRNESNSFLRPDVVLHLPQQRAIVIDSKVSLTAFTEMANAETDDIRSAASARHALSVKNHINELKNKRYQDYIGAEKLDFVIMFIPNEGAYLTAMQGDPSLWDYAYRNQVVMASPAHLMSILKMTHQLWNHDLRSRNAIKIAEEAGKLHDKIADFAGDMADINSALEKASKAWESAMKKMSTGKGNILKRTDDLRELGARASKRLTIPEE